MLQRFYELKYEYFLWGLRLPTPDCLLILPVPKLSPGYDFGHRNVFTLQVINSKQPTINMQDKHAECVSS